MADPAWESVPKLVRFAVWVWAWSIIIGLGVGMSIMLAVIARRP